MHVHLQLLEIHLIMNLDTVATFSSMGHSHLSLFAKANGDSFSESRERTRKIKVYVGVSQHRYHL